MKISAIICEYNPFHNGHKYQIELLKNNGFFVICLMSGNFVQRGENAIIDKYKRAKVAVLNGADLVIELPLPFCLSTSERFCFNGVRLLDRLNVVDTLCFGCEDDSTKLDEISKFLLSDLTINCVKNDLKSGISYPVSINNLINEYLGEEYFNIIKKPNNILAIEYIKALKKLNSKMSTIKVKRFLVDHKGKSKENIASASYIRELIENGDFNNALLFLPNKDIYKDTLNNGDYVDRKKEEMLMLGYLKHLCSDDFLNFLDVSDGFNNKLSKKIRETTDYKELLVNLTDKIYTTSRVRRILKNRYLGISKDVFYDNNDFLKVLASNDNGLLILKKIKENSNLTVSHSILKCDNKDYISLLDKSYNLFNMSLYNEKVSGYEFTSKFVRINNTP